MGWWNTEDAKKGAAAGGVIGAAGGGIGAVPGAIIGGVAGGLGVGTPLSKAGKEVGGFLGANNPFKKPDTEDIPDVVAPKDVTAPTAPVLPTSGNITAPTVQRTDPATINTTIAPATLTSMGTAMQTHQTNLANQLAGQAAGVGPSVAGDQLRAGQEANIAATFAAANSSRGGYNPAMARQAMQTSAEIQGKMAQEAATARLQEQMQAAGMLTQVAGQGVQQDLSLAGLNQEGQIAGMQGQIQLAGMNSQEAIAQAQIGLQAAQSNAEIGQAYAQIAAQYAAMGLDAQKANQMAGIEVQRLIQSGVIAKNQAILGADANQKGVIGGVLGAVGQGVAALA